MDGKGSSGQTDGPWKGRPETTRVYCPTSIRRTRLSHRSETGRGKEGPGT